MHLPIPFQVETYGSMERKEKVEFILEQMRLCLATKDYIRAQIISKKISIRYISDWGQIVLGLFHARFTFSLDSSRTTTTRT